MNTELAEAVETLNLYVRGETAQNPKEGIRLVLAELDRRSYVLESAEAALRVISLVKIQEDHAQTTAERFHQRIASIVLAEHFDGEGAKP